MNTTIAIDAIAGNLPVHFSATVSDGVKVAACARVEPLDGCPDTWAVLFDLSADGSDFTVESIDLSFEFSVSDMHGMYHPYGRLWELIGMPFWKWQYDASATGAPPLWTFFHQNGETRVAFGLADQLTPTKIESVLSEHSRTIVIRPHKPANGVLCRTQHTEAVFLSCARVPLQRMIAAYRAFVEKYQPSKILPVPECAYDPVFCTWTAVHTDVTPEWTERNAKLAVEMGFKTLLMDDGWQEWPDDAPNDKIAGGQSYPYLGSWTPHPRKFPDFASHVKRIQDMGMRYLLWVAPFFMGELYERYGEFKDKGWYRPPAGRPGGNVFLDPRYPSVVEYIRTTLRRLVHDYRLDGLKIDFVDGVGAKLEPNMSALPAGAESGPAIQNLLGGVADELHRENPDLMIECRQSYSNLAARRWTNCYRSPDVPLNIHQNRFNCAMLRMLFPDRAVYFDPALWPVDDTDENVARHMISAISAVPMISVEFDRYPKSHLDIVRHWIAFYRNHRGTLVGGSFSPEIVLGHNPASYFANASGTESIVGLYGENIVARLSSAPCTYILNGTSQERIFLDPDTTLSGGRIETFTMTGRPAGEFTLAPSCAVANVPVGGYAKFTR